MPRRNTLRKLTVVAMALVLGLIAVPVEWDTLGTVPLALDDGFHSQRRLSYGDINLNTAPPQEDSSLPEDGVVSLAGRAGDDHRGGKRVWFTRWPRGDRSV